MKTRKTPKRRQSTRKQSPNNAIVTPAFALAAKPPVARRPMQMALPAPAFTL
jgi:hypothetical protein